MPTADWADARDRMLLDPTVAYLNTGSFGPLPRSRFRPCHGPSPSPG